MFGSRTTVKKVRNSLTWFSHPWCFRAKQRFSVTCIPKSGRKNKLSLLHIPAFSRMYLWGDERKGSRVRTMPWLSSHHAASAVWHVYRWRGATSGSYFHLGVKGFGHLVWWPIYLKRDNGLSACQSLELECLDRYKHILLRRLWVPTDWHVLLVVASRCLGDSFNAVLVFSGLQGMEPLWKSGIFDKLLKKLWEPGFFRVLCTR